MLETPLPFSPPHYNLYTYTPLPFSPPQGFVPATNDVFESETIIPAAYAAINDVNANCSLLRNYTLQLDFVNTKVHTYGHVRVCAMQAVLQCGLSNGVSIAVSHSVLTALL